VNKNGRKVRERARVVKVGEKMRGERERRE
jgi:hypothetical protein